ncbi:integrase core domain-containing protein [Streptomyces sp. NPDC054933]
MPPRSPNCNPNAERFIRSVREECTNRLLIFDRSHAEKILQQYARHFDSHRPHHGRNQRAPLDDPNVIPLPTTRIERREAVTGLINEYHRPKKPQFTVTEAILKRYAPNGGGLSRCCPTGRRSGAVGGATIAR